MKSSSGDYNGLACAYHALEFLAFGHDLERARFTLMPMLATCRSILIIGEGDGRFLKRFLRLNSHAHIDCIDLSPAMLARAAERIGDEAHRVHFQAGDIRQVELTANHYDAVVTCFVLDCFSRADCAAIITRIGAALKSHALWLWSDFALPPDGFQRWRARLWVAALHLFFRWQTGQTVRELPPAESLFVVAGFKPIAEATFQRGLLRSVVFSQPGSGTRSS